MRIASALVALGALVAAAPATASSDKEPSAEETSAYIAAKLENCRSFKWGQHRFQVRATVDGPDIAISLKLGQAEDTPEFDIRDIHDVEFIGNNVDLEDRPLPQLRFHCREREKCIRVGGEFGVSLVHLPVCDVDTGERLGRAFRHLMKVTGKGKKMKELF